MEKLYEKVLYEIYSDARFNKDACEDQDVERASFTAGEFAAYCKTLRMMGYDVEDGTYTDNGCERIAYLKINCMVLMENSDWKYACWELFR